MITEDYVSFETAKLLKEKGFEGYSIITIYDEKAANAYIKELQEKHLPYSSDDPKLKEFYYAQLTLQMAMKLLREVHNWTICISPYWPEGDMRNKLTWYYDIHSLIDNRSFRESSYTDNYTEATESAIKYCLENLI